MANHGSGTNIVFYTDAQQRLTGFKVQGHSGYAFEGQDIVCAAVSALTQTILNGLKSVQRLPMVSVLDDKKAFLEAILSDKASNEEIEKAQTLLQTLLEGLQAIEQQYPKYVHVLFKERR